MASRSTRSGGYIIQASEVEALTGSNLKGMFSRVLRGGSNGHPLTHTKRFRWDSETDTYIISALYKAPTTRLFRRHGQWRISFDTPDLENRDTYLFSDASLDEPVYSIIAILYAAMTAKYPSLRNKAMRRMLEAA